MSFLVTFFARNDKRNPLRLVYILFKFKKTFGPCKQQKFGYNLNGFINKLFWISCICHFDAVAVDHFCWIVQTDAKPRNTKCCSYTWRESSCSQPAACVQWTSGSIRSGTGTLALQVWAIVDYNSSRFICSMFLCIRVFERFCYFTFFQKWVACNRMMSCVLVAFFSIIVSHLYVRRNRTGFLDFFSYFMQFTTMLIRFFVKVRRS